VNAGLVATGAWAWEAGAAAREPNATPLAFSGETRTSHFSEALVGDELALLPEDVVPNLARSAPIPKAEEARNTEAYREDRRKQRAKAKGQGNRARPKRWDDGLTESPGGATGSSVTVAATTEEPRVEHDGTQGSPGTSSSFSRTWIWAPCPKSEMK